MATQVTKQLLILFYIEEEAKVCRRAMLTHPDLSHAANRGAGVVVSPRSSLMLTLPVTETLFREGRLAVLSFS
jgi:hypothetical protein